MTDIPSDKLAVQISYWQTGAAEDLASATDIIANTSRYGAGLFFLHLGLEKILKAVFVRRHGQYAPNSHNLLSLATKCGLTPDRQQEKALAEFNEFNLETRYPDDRDAFLKRATKAYAEQSLATANGMYQWISQHLHP